MKTSLACFVALLGGGALAYGCGGGGQGTADGGGDTGSDTNVGRPDATTDTGGAGHDSGHDSGLPNPFGDTGTPPESEGGTCPTPANLGEWTPPAYVDPAQVAGACGASDFSDYFAACLSGAPTATCTTYTTAHAACSACLSTPLTNSAWGPLFTNDGVSHVNIAGCLDLTDPGDHTCAESVEEATQCETAACDSVCTVTDDASFTNWQTCISAADMEECATPSTASTNCLMAITSAAAAPCLSATTFEDYFLSVAPIFCGGGEAGAPEGGTDGGTDATTDSAVDGGGAASDAATDAPAG